MKQLFAITITAALAIASLASCRSNSTGSNTPPVDSTKITTITAGTMTASLNGVAWSGKAGGYRHAGQLNNLAFEGWVDQPHFQQIAIGLTPDITGPGTYPFSDDRTYVGSYASGSYNTETASYSTTVGGSVTITVLTATNVQGTFTLTSISGLGDTVHITNGAFNAPLD